MRPPVQQIALLCLLYWYVDIYPNDELSWAINYRRLQLTTLLSYLNYKLVMGFENVLFLHNMILASIAV